MSICEEVRIIFRGVLLRGISNTHYYTCDLASLAFNPLKIGGINVKLLLFMVCVTRLRLIRIHNKLLCF